MGFLFRAVLLPALIAGPLLIAFRYPRNMIELVIFPTALMLFGALWVVIGGTWRQLRRNRRGHRHPLWCRWRR